MNTRCLLLTTLLACAGSLFATEYKPEKWNLEARKQFAEQRFGIFIHWGLYSNYAQGEWYLESSKRVKESAYARMMHGFFPSKFNAEEWVKVFKDAGAKYVTITSRHHDGFSLWPSKVDDGYNIGNTPFKRDVLGELAAACRKAGLQLNFYYSLMDWHRPDYPTGRERSARNSLKHKNENYASYKKFMMGQLAELIENYKPGVIWFDGEWDHDPKWSPHANPIDWEFDDLYDFIHSKRVLVANNHHNSIRDKEDIQLFERDLPGSNESGFSAGQIVTSEHPIEQCDVLQNGVWGYRIAENGFRSPQEVVAMLARAAAKDSNLLMNIGPDGSGQLPEESVGIMKKVGEWMRVNGESIYGTTAGGVSFGKEVVSTSRGNILYLHFITPNAIKIAFRINGKILRAETLADGKPVAFERTAGGDAVISMPAAGQAAFNRVVKLTIEE